MCKNIKFINSPLYLYKSNFFTRKKENLFKNETEINWPLAKITLFGNYALLVQKFKKCKKRKKYSRNIFKNQAANEEGFLNYHKKIKRIPKFPILTS